MSNSGTYKRKYQDPNVGDTFGSWCVVSRPEKNKHNNHRKCLCKCKCGTTRKVNITHLFTGQSKGCRCVNAGKRMRPYEAIFNVLIRQAKQRNYKVSLTYESFLKFTQTEECHYCGKEVLWVKFNIIKNKGCAHHLDRKNNYLGYSRSNCVVCCPRCNRAKSNHFTYEEWVKIGDLIRSWRT